MPPIRDLDPYDDGGTTTINSTVDPIMVTNGTTVHVTIGASITGGDASNTVDTDGNWNGDVSQPAITSDSATLTISGGTITGGLGTDIDQSAGAGLISTGDNLTISGGTITSGIDWLNGPPAALITNPTALSISGGSFVGSDSIGNSGGTGAIISLNSTTTGTISGGSFVGGDPDGIAIGVSLSDSSQLSISGGSFTGPMDLRIADSATLTFTGSGLTYTAGILSGTLTSGEAITLTIVERNDVAMTVGGSTSARTFNA